MKDFQTQIDSYLDRICRPLARTLSADEVTDQRAEMCTHLEALFAAHLEAGRSESEAIRLSLEQFGKERKLQNAWKRECETIQLASEKTTSRPAFWFAVRTYAFAFLLPGVFVGCMILFPYLPGYPIPVMPNWTTIFLITVIAFPFLAGIRVGCCVRKCPILFSLAATFFTCLLIPTIIAVTYIGSFLSTKAPAFYNMPPVYWLILGCYYWLVVAVPVLIVTPVIGMIGTILGQLSKRFQRRRVAP